MQAEHVIAKCRWHSEFDHKDKAVELQDFISRWSNTVLVEELEQYFEQVCPSTQTWRIETLALDLGDIDLEDLPTELPKRIRECLHEAFTQLFNQQRLGVFSAGDSNFQIFDKNESWNAFTRWFFLHGTTPWWFKGAETALDILKNQIKHEPNTTLVIIQELGQSEAVRKRIVWQLGESVFFDIVHLLEPWQGDFICSYADNVIAAHSRQSKQTRNKIATTNTTEFKNELWYVILTHLLVDRGTIFNTVAFVSSTLRRLAQHYNIEFSVLVNQLSSAAVELESMGVVSSTFVTAIGMIHQQENKTLPVEESKIESTPDYWQLMRSMLHNSLRSKTVAVSVSGQSKKVLESINSDELFSVLTQQDSSRMATILKQEGASQRVRQGILKHFGERELALVVQVVNPQEHRFILAHVENTQTLLQQDDTDKKIVWQVLLDYLLADKGSYFNRRQFVFDTISQLCHHQQIEYRVLLDMLMHVVVQQPNQCRFELLSIFQDLKQDLNKKEPKLNSKAHSSQLGAGEYQAAFLEYLRTGKHVNTTGTLKAPHITTNSPDFTKPNLANLSLANLLDEIRRETPQLQHTGKSNLTDIVASKSLERISDKELSIRLLNGVRASDLSVLITLIQPEALSFCTALMRQLQQWHKQSWLPSLRGFDLGFQFPALVIQALLQASKIRSGTKAPFKLSEFWSAFSTCLANHSSVNLTNLNQELHICFKQTIQQSKQASGSSINNQTHEFKNDLKIVSELLGLLHAEILIDKQIDLKQTAIQQWAKKDLFVAFETLALHSDDHPSDYSQTNVEALWNELQLQHKATLLPWLNAKENRHQLISALRGYTDIQSLQHWLSTWFPFYTINGAIQTKKQPKHSANVGIAGVDISSVNIANEDSFFNSQSHSLSEALPYSESQAHSQHEKSQWSVEQLLNILENKLLRPGHTIGVNDNSALQSLSKEQITKLSQFSIDELCALLDKCQTVENSSSKSRSKTKSIEKIKQWISGHSQRSTLLQALVTNRQTSSIEHWLSDHIPSELQPPKDTIDQAYTLFLLSGLWQGASAVLHQQLTDIFWLICFDTTTQTLSVEKRLARMATMACLRLNIRIKDCIEGFKLQLPLLQKSKWKGAYGVLVDDIKGTDTKGADAKGADSENPTDQPLTERKANSELDVIKSSAENSVSDINKRDHKHAEQESTTNTEKNRTSGKISSLITFEQDYSAQYLNHPRFTEIARYLLLNGTLPIWVKTSNPIEIDRLLFDLFSTAPHRLSAIFGDLLTNNAVLFRLTHLVPFTWLIDAIQKSDPSLSTVSDMLHRFYQCLSKTSIKGMDRQQQMHVFLQLVLKQWVSAKGGSIAPDTIIQSFCWQLMQQHSVSMKDLRKAFSNVQYQLPEILHITLSNLLEHPAHEHSAHKNPARSAPPVDKKPQEVKTSDLAPPVINKQNKALKKLIDDASNPDPILTPMGVSNAGLVIVQSFIKPLFQRLSLVENDAFVSDSAQRRAVHYLQFLVTGCTKTPEQHLMLNKIVCGLRLYDPVELEIEISDKDKETCHSLLNSVIGYWTAIGHSSIDGFRGNWLVRDGSLTDAKDRWDLIVEKRAYDVLLTRSPLSYSVIKLPWMEKAIYVTWPT